MASAAVACRRHALHTTPSVITPSHMLKDIPHPSDDLIGAAAALNHDLLHEKGHSSEKDDGEPSEQDLRLLAEAIDLYFKVAPVEGESPRRRGGGTMGWRVRATAPGWTVGWVGGWVGGGGGALEQPPAACASSAPSLLPPPQRMGRRRRPGHRPSPALADPEMDEFGGDELDEGLELDERAGLEIIRNTIR